MIPREKMALHALEAIQKKVFERAMDAELWSPSCPEYRMKAELVALHDTIEMFSIPLLEKESVGDVNLTELVEKGGRLP